MRDELAVQASLGRKVKRVRELFTARRELLWIVHVVDLLVARGHNLLQAARRLREGLLGRLLHRDQSHQPQLDRCVLVLW